VALVTGAVINAITLCWQSLVYESDSSRQKNLLGILIFLHIINSS
jgi:hypothetical protein